MIVFMVARDLVLVWVIFYCIFCFPDIPDLWDVFKVKLRTSYETNCGSAETLCFIGFRDYYPCWDSAVCTVPARVVPEQCKLHCLRLWRGHGNPWKTLEKQENDPENRHYSRSGMRVKNASFANSCEGNDPF